MLTNKEDGYFTITEMEVWEIKNVENLVLKNKEWKETSSQEEW